MHRIRMFSAWGRGLALVWALAGARPAVAQDAGSPPCGSGADHEPVETRCDGIDNDCDGLVDVLMPTAANACAPVDGLSCAPGHAACLDGQRVCLAPGPAPEVADGVDNDCNGVVDDVGSGTTQPGIRARALLLVPGYAFTDAPLEIDQIASVLDQWGIAFDRPSGPADFDAALAGLAQYPLVIVPGYLEEDFLVPFRQAALEAYVQQGGVLVVFKPIFADGSPTHQLIGTTSTARRSDADAIAFVGPRAGATRAFDSPEELRVAINDASSGEPVFVHVLAPAPQTQVLATASAGGAPIGPVLTRRAAGAGAVYAVGHDLHTALAQRCYINCFEPAGDLAGLFLREAFREGTHGHLVVKHTVPGPEDSLAIFSHDLCALDAQQPGDGWGEPGALQIAAAEQRWGARGSFFATTQNVTTDESIPYYSPGLMQQLCGMDMCPVGAHSVVHPASFGQLPLGTCLETPDTYTPAVDPTACGEVGVSLDLVAQANGVRPVAWRSPFLDVNPSQYDALAAQGVLLDSSYAIGDLKSNLPVSLAHTGMNQVLFHHQPLYAMPIALEDGIGGVELGVATRQEMGAASAPLFTALWTYTLLRNADNGAHTMSLMHPSYGVGQPQDNVRNKVAVLESVLQAARARGIRVQSTAADLAAFWQAREETAVDASYLPGTPGRYAGTIRTGAHAPTDLTLEFGDVISSFDCPGCAGAQVSGKRVTLRGALPAAGTTTFEATVGGGTATTVPAVPAVPDCWLLFVSAALIGVALGRRGRRAAVLTVAAILLHAPGARGDATPYCARVRERAAADAALLVAPRLLVQGLRFPDNATLEGGTLIAQGFQLRAGVAFSATDLYKGLGLRQVADADCRAHDARVALEATLADGDAEARQAALQAQLEFLEAHAADARQIVARAGERFSAHAITLVELEDLRGRAGTLERLAIQARGQAAQLAASRATPDGGAGAADRLARTYAEATGEGDRAVTRVRAADPWQLEVTAGVIPSSRFDWYGILQFGFNLGGLAQPGHAAAYARAHQEEVAGAPYEPGWRLVHQRQQLAAAREQARRELDLVQRQLETVESTAQVLAGTDAAGAVHHRDRLALDRLALGAQRVFQDAYLAALGRLVEHE